MATTMESLENQNAHMSSCKHSNGVQHIVKYKYIRQGVCLHFRDDMFVLHHSWFISVENHFGCRVSGMQAMLFMDIARSYVQLDETVSH